MARSLNLADIVALADSGAYGGNRVLSANSAAIALCSGVFLSQLWNWQGAGFDLTEDEIDDILAMVATLEYELMTDAEATVSDYVKLEQSIHTSDVVEVVLDDFQDSAFIRYELYVSGMHSDATNEWTDILQMKLNNVGATSPYDTLSRVASNAGEYTNEDRGTVVGIRPISVCGAKDGAYRTIGSMHMTFLAPNDDDYTRMQWDGGLISTAANASVVANGVAQFKRDAVLDEIALTPTLGTTFLIGGNLEPTRLIATIYGVK